MNMNFYVTAQFITLNCSSLSLNCQPLLKGFNIMSFYGKEVITRKQENKPVSDKTPNQKTILRRRIEDCLRKYCNEEMLKKVADLLNVKY